MSKDLQVSGSPGSSVDAFFANDRNTSVQRLASGRLRIASVDSLHGFLKLSNDTLVRVSQKDFWKLGEDEEGFYIERLVDDDSGPVHG